MKVKTQNMFVFAAGLCLLFGLYSCGVSDNPILTEPTETELTVFLNIQPTTSLRTLDTWNAWNTPIDAVFYATLGGSDQGDTSNGHGHNSVYGFPTNNVARLTSEEGEDDAGVLIGTLELAGIQVSVTISDGEGMWEIHHGGEAEEHHAMEGESHADVELVETVTGHHPHGGPTISHCEVSLVAESAAGDIIEIDLVPVQGGHGYRYESNAELPFGTYDIHLEIEPPSFYRTEETHEKWTSHIEFEFHDFVFDSAFTGGAVGESIWVGAADDSIKAGLRAGSVKTYGAVGIGQVPLTGGETINFSLRLEDPTAEAHGQPLFGSIVTLTTVNGSTGKTVTKMLVPKYGAHGFHFGNNMDMDLDHIEGEHDPGHDDGHGHE
jgi:uncharacterized protein involved in high-affinity Fe2+ transport